MMISYFRCVYSLNVNCTLGNTHCISISNFSKYFKIISKLELYRFYDKVNNRICYATDTNYGPNYTMHNMQCIPVYHMI